MRRQEEGGDDQEHGDETGKDDSCPVGRRVSLQVEGEGHIRIGFLYTGILVGVESHGGVDNDPFLVVCVKVEIFNFIFAIEQPEADLVSVRGPTAKL